MIAETESSPGYKWNVRGYHFPNPGDRSVEPRVGSASAVRVVGPGLRKYPTDIDVVGPAGASGTPNLEAQDRAVRLYSQEG